MSVIEVMSVAVVICTIRNFVRKGFVILRKEIFFGFPCCKLCDNKIAGLVCDIFVKLFIYSRETLFSKYILCKKVIVWNFISRVVKSKVAKFVAPQCSGLVIINFVIMDCVGNCQRGIFFSVTTPLIGVD